MENTVDNKEFDLLLSVSSYYNSLIVKETIIKLKALRGNKYLLSGDDSDLKNIWEEICCQVQGEESSDWDVYINTIENFIDKELANTDVCFLNVLNYVHYIEIAEDKKDDEPSLVQSILEDILFQADYFTNSNIKNFLNDDYEEEEEDEDEEEEDDEQELKEESSRSK